MPFPVRLLGRDGSVWHLSAESSGRDGVHLGRRRRMPDWLDRLIVVSIGWVITAARWNRWP